MRTKDTFTIHTELINGTLQGTRNIYMGANSTCHLYVIPRENIAHADKIKDIAGQPAFYILTGDTCSDAPQAYIGQTTDFSNRKNDHLQKKEWWQTALIFVSDNHKIYGDDVKYLEYLAIEAAQCAATFELLNNINPKRPTIAPFRINDMEAFFRDIQLLTRFYGCKIFDTPATSEQATKYHEFFLRQADTDATMRYYPATAEYILLAGSKIAATDHDSISKEIIQMRDALRKETKKYKADNRAMILLQDHNITTKKHSPSGAAGFCTGTAMQGTTAWVDADGYTFGRVFPKER